MIPRIRRVLFDFDQVLARYHHDCRIAHLAAFAGCTHGRVRAALFDSGLETEYDCGRIDTADYLQRLGDGIGRRLDTDTWIASRIAGSRADAGVLARVAALDAAVPLAILTNNGVLMAHAIPHVIAPVFARFDGRVLCSGALRLRKPEPAIYARALDLLGWAAAGTLFVDDSFANVQGARRAGLEAETVRDARSMRRVFKRFGLLSAAETTGRA